VWPVSWHPPVPPEAVDDAGARWLVVRAWPDSAPGEYVLEVAAPGRPGIRAAHFRQGRLDLVPLDDPGLPALRREAEHGEVVVHRAHKRAVIRTPDQYIKVYRPGHAEVPAERCARSIEVLAGGGFVTPRILRVTPDVLAFSRIPGRRLLDLGQDHDEVSDESFAWMWAEWSRAWVALLGAEPGHAAEPAHAAVAGLPLRTPEAEVAALRRWVDPWLRHSAGVPEAQAERDALQARTESVAENLLRSAPDPPVWALGDLHDKHIIGLGGGFPVGLVDFDEAARAEPALDLANLDVHLDVRLRQDLLTPERCAAAHAQVRAAVGQLGVSNTRFQAYAAAHRLRLACLYSFRPRWAALASGLLHEQLSEHLQEHLTDPPLPAR
jgi:hypothetical protein